MTASTKPELWRHPDPTSTPLWKFVQHVNSKYGLDLKDYPAVYRWSIDNVAEFWEEAWHFVGIRASKSFDKVRTWFPPMPQIAAQLQPPRARSEAFRADLMEQLS